MAALTGRFLKITVAATEYDTQVFECVVVGKDADASNVTFKEASEGGGRDYVAKIKLTQDQAASTLWTLMWDSPGTDVAVVLKPYGNAVPTASQPHWSFSCTIKEADDLFGGEANPSPTERWQTEVEWPLTARPVRITSE